MTSDRTASSNASARGWLLNFGDGRWAAVGEKELHEVVPDPVLTEDRSAPAHCRGRLAWRGLTLPVMDLAVVFGADADREPARWLTVAAYVADGESEPAFAALRLQEPPVPVRVDDAMASSLPETSLRDYLVWSFLGLSCFRHGDRSVPIIDLARLFAPQAQARLTRFSTVRELSLPERAVRSEAVS
ncbi:MAG: chemotaxis protein CheW [Aquisalimonadaceae bacterium]